MDMGKPTRPQPYTKNYRQLKNMIGKDNLPWERAYKFTI